MIGMIFQAIASIGMVMSILLIFIIFIKKINKKNTTVDIFVENDQDFSILEVKNYEINDCDFLSEDENSFYDTEDIITAEEYEEIYNKYYKVEENEFEQFY